MAYLGSFPLGTPVANTVVAGSIASGAVNSTAIAADAVTSTAIAADAVTSTAIATGAVLSADIATDISLSNVTVTGNVNIGQAVFESANITASAVGANITLVAHTSGVIYFTSNATANTTVNLTGVSQLDTGKATAYTLFMTNGSTPYKVDTVQVEGAATTVKWASGAAPSTGYAGNTDVYSFVVLKTGASTYSVFANQLNYG